MFVTLTHRPEKRVKTMKLKEKKCRCSLVTLFCLHHLPYTFYMMHYNIYIYYYYITIYKKKVTKVTSATYIEFIGKFP